MPSADDSLSWYFTMHHDNDGYPKLARCTARGCIVRFRSGPDRPCSAECVSVDPSPALTLADEEHAA